MPSGEHCSGFRCPLSLHGAPSCNLYVGNSYRHLKQQVFNVQSHNRASAGKSFNPYEFNQSKHRKTCQKLASG